MHKAICDCLYVWGHCSTHVTQKWPAHYVSGIWLQNFYYKSEFWIFFTRDLQHATLLLIVLRTQPTLLSVKYPFKFMRKYFKNLCTFYFNYIPWFIKYRWFMIYQRNRFFSLSDLNSVDSILLPWYFDPFLNTDR